MKIAVFEKDYNNAIRLKKILYSYSNLKKLNFVVDIYSDFKNLIALSENYVLIFLSFENEYINNLSKKSAFKKILDKIIITGDNYQIADKAFRIHACNFSKTPYQKNVIFEILESFFATNTIIVPIIADNTTELFCLNVCDILYLEANNKHSIIHLTDKSVYCNKTMAKIFSVLPDDIFLKINRAFVVNLNHITRFNSKIVILSNNVSLNPTRHFYKTFKSDYMRIKTPKIP